ncbi:MAG: hypothetical protein PHG25_02320 [Candidatus Pacebacteria bacterium]|nr:hypothetical protein [Candidatus Paceibacterota bacterium]
MTLDIEDKNYIGNLLDQKLDQKFGHYFGLLRDDFNHKFSLLVEISKDKPNREEVREIVREEAGYVVQKTMKDIFAPEVKEIRVTQAKHEKRISKLEAARI